MQFENVETQGFAAIENCVRLNTSESLTLEFKAAAAGGKNPFFTASGILTRDGRTTLAKAVAAFANSAGGTIMFGIECRRKSDGSDGASRLDLVPSVANAVADINGRWGELVQPAIEGLRVLAVFAPGSDQGCVVVGVPRSERRPHRSGIDQRYYQRNGSNTHVMEHYAVEDQFRRFVSPTIELVTSMRGFSSSSGPEGTVIERIIELGIRNTSSITAKLIILQLMGKTGIDFIVGDQYGGTPTSYFGGVQTIHAGQDFCVHPGQERKLDGLRYTIRKENSGAVTIGKMPAEAAFLRFEYRLGAENMRLTPSVLELDAAVLGQI